MGLENLVADLRKYGRQCEHGFRAVGLQALCTSLTRSGHRQTLLLYHRGNSENKEAGMRSDYRRTVRPRSPTLCPRGHGSSAHSRPALPPPAYATYHDNAPPPYNAEEEANASHTQTSTHQEPPQTPAADSGSNATRPPRYDGSDRPDRNRGHPFERSENNRFQRYWEDIEVQRTSHGSGVRSNSFMQSVRRHSLEVSMVLVGVLVVIILALYSVLHHWPGRS